MSDAGALFSGQQQAQQLQPPPPMQQSMRLRALTPTNSASLTARLDSASATIANSSRWFDPEDEDPDEDADDLHEKKAAKRRKKDQHQVADFIKKLFSAIDDNCFPSHVAWSPKGNSFVVFDTNEFSRHVLPLLFKHKNFQSFVRQLNKYGFSKVRASDDFARNYGDQSSEFQHPCFVRGCPERIGSILRKKTAAKAEHATSSSTRPTASRATAPAPRDVSVDAAGPNSPDGAVKPSPTSEPSQEDKFSASPLDPFAVASNALIQELESRIHALKLANESTESGMKLLVQQYMNLQRELAHWKSVVEWQDNLVASLKSGNQENAVRVQQILKALRSQPTEPVGSQSQSHIAADAASGSINKNLNHATDFSPLILPTNPQPFMGTSSFSNSSPPLNLTGFTYPGIGGCDTGSSLSSMANLTGGGGDLDSLMHVLNFESLGALDFGSSGNAASNIPLIPFQLAPERAGLSGRTMNTASVTSLFQQLKNEQLRQVTSGTVFEPINPPNPRYRALLIEDDLPYQKVFCLHLQKLNIAFDILRTRDQVEQALLPTNAAVLHSYQVVFMDLQMEGIDGPCVARTIRQRGGRQCFIVMSGTQLSPVEFDMYRAAGSSGCLMKPFSPQGLRAALTSAGFVLDA